MKLRSTPFILFLLLTVKADCQLALDTLILPFSETAASSSSKFEVWDDKLWIANDGAGIYFTADTGNSFIAANKGIETNKESILVTTIATHKKRLYCATKYNGLYIYKKTTNRWYRLKKGLIDSTYWSLKSNGEYLFATSEEGGLLYSKGGLEWKKVNVFIDNKLDPFNSPITGKTMLHTIGTVVFLAMPKRLMVSTSSGKNWRHIRTPTRGDLAIMHHIAGSGDTLAISYLHGGTFVSTDGGKNWIEPEGNPSRAWTAQVLNGSVWVCNPFNVKKKDFGVYIYNQSKMKRVIAVSGIDHITYHKGYYFLGASTNKLYRFTYPQSLD